MGGAQVTERGDDEGEDDDEVGNGKSARGDESMHAWGERRG